MNVEQIKSRADEQRIIHECAIKIRALIDEAAGQMGGETEDGDSVEELISKLVFD
jgi:hypothetical protein